jgi:hypothetical protein
MGDMPGMPHHSAGDVPSGLRDLAAAEKPGALRSVHRLTSWLKFRQGRIYLYDQGFVLRQAHGFQPFRFGQYTVGKARAGYMITGSDGLGVGLSRKW